MSPVDLPQRLTRSRRLEREQAWLLGAAAGLCWLTAGWLLLSPGVVLRLLAIAGIGFGLLFARRARGALGAAAHAQDRFLELDRGALKLCDDGEGRTLPWSQVHGVGVDEDRLVVVLVDAQGENLLEIEPSYGELGVHDLREAVARAWRTARG